MKIRQIKQIIKEAQENTKNDYFFFVLITLKGELRSGKFIGLLENGRGKYSLHVEHYSDEREEENTKVKDIAYFKGLSYEDLARMVEDTLSGMDEQTEKFREIAIDEEE